MIRAFIVDDEPPARVRLRQLLTEVSDVIVVGEAGDALEAQGAIADVRPDVVFLDIEMPEISGTELAASLPEPRPYVVFATAFDHYALAAFAVDATDYLVKPITRGRLSGTLARLRERLSRRSELERELVAASAVQSMLLPRTLPMIPGYDSAAMTVPARGVGGDFFLSQQITPTRYVLALGDVSGKGLSASLVASSLQARIEAVTRHAHGTASELIADVNRSLCKTSEGGRYATLAYLELDTDHSQLTVVNAAHLPLIVTSPSAETQRISATSPPLGLFPEARFETSTVTLLNESLVVAYSDGVTESLNADGDEFEEHRLLDVITQHANGSAADVCRAVVKAVHVHTGHARAADDVTVMAVKGPGRSAGSGGDLP